MFYIMGSAVLGSLVMTTANGSQAAKSVQHGLLRWTDRISDADRLYIMKRRYGNEPEAIQKFRMSNPQQAEHMFPEDLTVLDPKDFTTDGFLVCLHLHASTMEHLQQALQQI